MQAQALVASVRDDAAKQISETEPIPSGQKPVNERESIKDRYSEVFHLYDEGKSVDAIAKQTGIQRGEVQLILQLAEREEG